MLQNLLQDAAFAARGLIRRPFYPCAIVLMIAAALAANMAAFSIFYGYNVKPLPYAQPSRLFFVSQTNPVFGHDDVMASANAYRVIRTAVSGAQDAGLWTYGAAVVAIIQGKPHEVDLASATPSFFTTLGTQPLLGRLLDRAAGVTGGPHEAVISYQFWHGTFNGRPDVLGQSVPVNGTDYQIVGVMPADFGFNNPTDLWASWVPPTGPLLGNNVNDFLVLRAAQGVTIAELDVQLAAVLPQIQRLDPPSADQSTRQKGDELKAEPVRPVILAEANIGSVPLLLQATALFLLLLAIANAGNLALVRNRARLSDFALRRVLGAGRVALLRLFLLEHVPILIGATVLGAVLGWLTLLEFASHQDVFSAPPLDIATGWPIYAFAVTLSVIALLVIVLVPVWQISIQTLTGGAGQNSKSTLSRGARRAQTAFGVLQVGVATALLAGSAMMSLSFYMMLTQPLGFEPHQRLVASVLMPPDEDNADSLAKAATAVSHLPITTASSGVAFGAYPFSNENADMGLSPNGTTTQIAAGMVAVTDGYFQALGIHIEQGHNFGPSAFTGAGQSEVIVTPELARALFGHTDVVGQMVDLLKTDYRIIGVTGPVLWNTTPDQATHGEAFFPAASITTELPFIGFSGTAIIADMAGPRQEAAQVMKATIERTIPGCVVTDVQPYGAVIDSYNAFRAVAAGLVAGFALIALLLAGFGVYAVNAFIARARLPEFGMRAMLGASPARLLRLALSDAAWLLGLGLGSGLVGGYLLVRAMSSLLVDVDAAQPAMFALVAAVIAGIVLLAAWRPAARAANMPVKSLLDAS
jgi:putative ABC transport system permease protein